ncbi:DNA adenine methylase [Caldifermentibacillus hisashii]|uniref:DNA adenine methylase n=1 Tax=Caldifermentibacillus hisashii TaxID=996558 RepID=UPI0031019A0F|nr:DNA adenine methylase [Caldibacillus thermoamylovorans]
MPVTDSPLRYPGGKTQMKKFIVDLIKSLPLEERISYVEAYAGGAGVALSLLLNNFVSDIYINDADPSIYKFWFSILNQTNEFIYLINETPITMEQWQHQKNIQKDSVMYSDLEVGFSTFFLNRTNVSGIIKGGPIGGKSQEGKYKLDCRFNKKALIKKIRRIAQYREKIHISNLDAADFIKEKIYKMNPKNTFIFFDPPYYKQGQNLYTNYYQHDDHIKISQLITSLDEYFWITTYDYSLEIEKIYKSQNKKAYYLNYSANKVRKAKEVLIFNKNIQLPDSKNIIYVE